MWVSDFYGTGVWYLATPYSKWAGGIDDAAHRAALIATTLHHQGLVVFSPIVHSHALCVADREAGLHRLDALSHDYWLKLDKAHAAASCGLIVAMMEGWRESAGIRREIAWYKQEFKTKPRFQLDPEDLYLMPM